jgi:hypothetical protein
MKPTQTLLSALFLTSLQPLTGFQIAGADQQWKPAEPKIVGDTVPSAV